MVHVPGSWMTTKSGEEGRQRVHDSFVAIPLSNRYTSWILLDKFKVFQPDCGTTNVCDAQQGRGGVREKYSHGSLDS